MLAGMSSASGGGFAAVLFFGGAGHLFFNCQQLRLRYGRVVFPARHTGLSVVNHTQKRVLCLGRRYEEMLLTHSFLFRCVSQPPPLRGTSFHRKEGESCPRIASPYRHFERKREIFFVCGQEEMREHRKTGSTVLHTLLAHGVSFAKETASGQRKAFSAASMRRGFL